ncbi:histone deacetylase 11-like [Rhagoletis pomonella]|uniref:histone deacetylase 11-like n=1 Tax=Rhagoletis pomonella TaxID=28610 RepID=UPI001781F859|nr:histone deacetylase 11-like [Rhagoletis pomonella]XP_036324670.1 histone deacetylase 11-like [Rhagoletis pomonella]
MKRFTEKVHHEQQQEVVWVMREDVVTPEQQQGKRKPNAEEENESLKLPIVYSNSYGVRFCGMEKLHPFDAAKGAHVLKCLLHSEVLCPGQFYEPTEITKEDLQKVHTRQYLRSLKWSLNAAKISEIPLLLFVPNTFVQRGYLRPMRFQTAGSILAGTLALRYGWAINLGGGFHHCCAYKGGGFCPYADITLLITKTFEEEPDVETAMIVDLDAHQGNGHERDFHDNNKVFILDMYNASIYPRDHEAKLAIRCAVELRPRTADEIYLRKLKRSLKHSLNEFRPDLLVYNAGTDVLLGDPLGLLSITPEGVMERDQFVFATCREQRIPIVMLLSGGYLKSSAKVIADSIVNLKAKGLLAS